MLRALKGTGSMTPCSQRYARTDIHTYLTSLAAGVPKYCTEFNDVRGGIKLYYRIIYTIQWELRG
uniref:Uncharacterized protein n=1 Tax=Triticum urartu TaxID=4572 RepID=A0A8R7UMB0_TRIUA